MPVLCCLKHTQMYKHDPIVLQRMTFFAPFSRSDTPVIKIFAFFALIFIVST